LRLLLLVFTLPVDAGMEGVLEGVAFAAPLALVLVRQAD
jgi:uncharacterized membrane protein (DUF4010 family)